MRLRKGFTLIELLVVISIIALLLAIMMPALGMVKEKARSVVCRTNLKQLYLGATVYASENGGKLVQYDVQQNGTPARLWISRMSDYVGDVDESRYCGSAKVDESASAGSIGTARKCWAVNVLSNSASQNSGQYNGDGDSSGQGYETECGSYAYNGWLYSPDQNGNVGADTSKSYRGKLYGIRQSASVPMFADAIWYEAWPLAGETIDKNSFNFDDGDAGTSMGRLMIDRHGMKSNLVFADGHADSAGLAEFWSFKWNRGFRTTSEEWGDSERQE
ncbi:putative major pilin subunit [Anaerohalosphaera lusitana]|uniref:Putative major pilin subunit n=1 Tax=Anaerohalosphaera lusitana TaxID=1936003 RepID=A0A1U9NQU0_9BACT|nr:type II secretion system protein [Anaerohalosphaera lusitana]AQT70279.1 putative major pilin subunit [Anaerohalosphaera lusitana]